MRSPSVTIAVSVKSSSFVGLISLGVRFYIGCLETDPEEVAFGRVLKKPRKYLQKTSRQGEGHVPRS